MALPQAAAIRSSFLQVRGTRWHLDLRGPSCSLQTRQSGALCTHSPGSGSPKTCSRRSEARAPSGSCSFYWEKSCPSKRRQAPHPSRETHEGEPRLFLSTKNTWRQIRAYNSAKMHCQGKRVLLSPSPTFCSRHLCCPRAPL